MPTVRRRQRLSSSCTAPAERSPAISSRATSLRISTGRSIDASASRVARLERERRLAERQALEVDGAHQAVLGLAGLRAQHLHGQRAGGVVGVGERMRRRQAAGQTR